jgi:ATP-dependent DNA helicase PIF1
MMPSDTTLPFVLKRRQFPVILAFVMTIHKSQGQSFDKFDVYLTEPIFTHGQLYVALARVRQRSNLKVYLPPEAQGKTKNIVYDELIRSSHKDSLCLQFPRNYLMMI